MDMRKSENQLWVNVKILDTFLTCGFNILLELNFLDSRHTHVQTYVKKEMHSKIKYT